MRARKKHKRNQRIPINKPEECERCKIKHGLEREHIIPLSKGGKDESTNLRYMCTKCHDLRHTEDRILYRIKRFERTDSNGWKIKMWRYRLEVINKLNPVDDESQEYISYWSERTTHTSYWYYWCVIKKTITPPIK